MDMFAEDSNPDLVIVDNHNADSTENYEATQSKDSEPQDNELPVDEPIEGELRLNNATDRLGDDNQDTDRENVTNIEDMEEDDSNDEKNENVNVEDDNSECEDTNIEEENQEKKTNMAEKNDENEFTNIDTVGDENINLTLENDEKAGIDTDGEEQNMKNEDDGTTFEENKEVNEGVSKVEEQEEEGEGEKVGEDEEESEGDDDDDDGEEAEEGDWETDDDDDDEDTDGDDDDDDDEEEDDDDESEDEDEEEMADESAALAESDSDIEGCENCPICLCKLKNQDIGTPESCDHCFCLECIQEWSKNVNTCPVDRQIFHLIFAKHPGEDKVFKRITVEDKKMDEEMEEEESPTYCEICGDCNREDRLLLCDGCDLGYHCECLDPPLDTIPVEEWFCPECAELNRPDQRAAEVVDDDDEIRFIITENDTMTSTLRPRRMIARTRVSERVRANLEQMRLQRSRRFTRPEIVESDDAEEPVPGSSLASNSSTMRSTASPKKAAARKYKRKMTKRKTSKRKSTKRKTAKRKVKKGTATRKRKGAKRKGKRRKGKRVVKEKLVPAVSVKSRLAKSLGLSKPPAGRTIPLQKTSGEKSTDVQRCDFGVSSLSILGHKDELIAFQDEEPTTSDSTVQSKPPTGNSRYSKSSLHSRFPLVKPRTKRFSAEVNPAKSDGASSSPLDILGSIMQDQTKLHLTSEKITINRDGSLTEKDSKSKKEKTVIMSDRKVNKKESSCDKSSILDSSSLYAGIDDNYSQENSEDHFKPVSGDINKEDNSYPAELFEDKWTLGVMLTDKEDNSLSNVKSQVTDVKKSNHCDNSKDVVSSCSTSVKSNVLDDCKYLDLEISHQSSRRSSSESKESGEITQDNETMTAKTLRTNERKLYKKSPIKTESKPVKGDSVSSRKEKYDDDIVAKDSDKNDDESGPERSVFKKKGKINISINFRDNSAFSKDDEGSVDDHDSGDIRKMDHTEKTRSHKSSHESQRRKSSKSEHRKYSSHSSRDKEYHYLEDNSQDTFDVDFDSYDAGKIPVSEFPKIPKKKKEEVDDDVVEVIVIDDSDAQKPEYDSRGSLEKKRRDKRDEEYDDRWRKSERDRGKYKDDHRTDYHRKDKDESIRKDREGHRSKERDRERDDHRYKHKKDRYRERSRSHSRERKIRERSRSRSRERGRRSRSRERITRSRSRERKRHSRSRSKERSSRKRRTDKSKDRGYRSKSPSHRDEDMYKTKSPRKDRMEKDNLLYHSMKQKKQLEKPDKQVVDDDKSSDDVTLLQEKEDNRKNQSDDLESNVTETPVEKPKRNNKTNSEITEVSKIEVVTGAKRPSESASNNKEFKKFKVDKSDSLILVKDKDVIDGNVDFTEKMMESVRESETRDCANIQVVVGVLDNNKDKEKPVMSGGITQLSEEYDPACPTDDALGQTPTPTPPPPELGLLPPPPMTENLGPPVSFPAHILEESHRLSPLPGQGILGEGGPFLVPSGERPTLLQQSQNMGPLPLRFRMFPPGFRPGLPHQQHMIMNHPMFMNRQPQFSGFAQLPPGHLQRFGIQVSGPTEVIPIQNRFSVPSSTIPGQPSGIPQLNGPGGLQMHPNDLPGQPGGLPPPHASGIHIHPGSIPGQSGPINGGEFEHLPPDPNAPPPHFPPHLLQHPGDLPMGDPRFAIPIGQPNPLLQHLNPLEQPEHGGLAPASLPDGISTNLVPISLSGNIPNIPSSLPNISSSVAPMNSSQTEVSPALHQIQQITKLLNTQHQLALLSKDKEESDLHSGISQENWDCKKENSPPVKSGTNKSGEKNVFKVPFPPNLSQNNQKLKSNSSSDNGMIKNKDGAMETTEVIDMDMSSPLDEGSIEIADSPEFDSIIFGYKREGSSKRDSDNKNVKKDTSDSDRKNKENISKVRFKDDKSVHSSSSSGSSNVTKSKTSENKVRSSKEKTNSKEKDSRKSHRDRKHREHGSHKDKRQPTSSEKRFDEIMNELSSQDEIPSSAVELTNKEKYLKKLHLQERVVDEVKVALKPFYSSRKINKEQYKDILRRAVPKVCHSKSGDINPVKIKSLVEAYVEKFIRNSKKKESPGALKSNGERLNIKTS